MKYKPDGRIPDIGYLYEKDRLKKITRFSADGKKTKEPKRDFSGSPVVKALPPHAGGANSIPGWGVKISYALWSKSQKHNREALW